MRSAWWDMANRFNSLLRRFMPHRQSITQHPRHPFIIIAPIKDPAAAASGPEKFVAGEHLAPVLPKQRRNLWAWGAALLLHILVVAAVLFVRVKAPHEDLQSPPGVSVVFEPNGTAPDATAPPTPLKGPQQPASAPPQPPPPAATATPQPVPAQETTAQAAAQDEVQVPDMPLSDLPSPPPAPTPAPPKPAPPRHNSRPSKPRPSQQQKYVFLNGMNYGNVSPVAPPAPKAPAGMNFALPSSDAQAATSSDYSVKGNAGADWGAALTKWVEQHAYYPQAAAEQGQQGTAEVEFTVDRNGHVSGLRLLTSAGSTFLDQAWAQLFADNTLPPFPPDAKDDHVVVRYTVHYILTH